ncbi:MAG: sugar phosphate isomerase/epimerase [Bacteroidales bacterium]|nr:sugar phosphate isomerase/epimerase [Bacteroidales bacterium]
MRLGGPVWGDFKDPNEWAKAVKAKGYSAALCPVSVGAEEPTIKSFEKAAKEANIIIAEVGAWSNPLSPNEEIRKNAIKKCKDSLALAELIGARCCVNVSGSRGDSITGPHPDNLKKETFDMIVQITREIIDEIKPSRTYFALEALPWSFPDSPDSYLKLMKGIDRKQLAVNLDPVNMINSPSKYFYNSDLIKECFEKLGPYIKNCHAKDIKLRDAYTIHFDDVTLGTGGVDFKTYLSCLSKLKDIPLMMEHMNSSEEYEQATITLRAIGSSTGIQFY